MSGPPCGVVWLWIHLVGTAALAQPSPEIPFLLDVPSDVHALRPYETSLKEPSEAHAIQEVREEEQAAPPAGEQALTGLIALGILGEQGVRVMKLNPEDWAPPGMTVSRARLYVATGWMALEVTLSLARGERPWTPAGAVVDHWQSEKASPKVVVRLLEGVSLLPGGSARMVVEWETPTEQKSLRCKLLVSERDGEREFKVTALSIADPLPDTSRRGGRP
ncbi:DUF2381 family protein [Stigmatella sp. ncwal1]|uniref:DUF2381 family protein n=1 Tax=Stigmatella ashevillensis TaxID=2995309 RepID=A0ABT5DEV5_9BACT|nr:DUF2381 family protein [Stigmatella ashevillena]MDC0711333.1 DUF2381 family protein [Stigmatella ashevillena]